MARIRARIRARIWSRWARLGLGPGVSMAKVKPGFGVGEYG